MRNSGLPCVVCGKVPYETEGKILSCSYCGQSESSDLACEDDHYLCESCRICTPTEIIHRTCIASTSNNPLQLANLLMHHPAISIFGPEHHFLASAVLLAVAHNAGSEMNLETRLGQAAKRVNRFGLSCASFGVCGAAMAVPIAISLLLAADYAKAKERHIVLKASASASARIADLPAPRCCKASVYSSLSVGHAYLSQELGLEIPSIPHPVCQFMETNFECLGRECPYYGSNILEGEN